jgi:hypothetical protein
MIGRRQVYPAIRPFPIWRYREIDDFMTGITTGKWAWLPETFMTVEVGSKLAEAFPMREPAA